MHVLPGQRPCYGARTLPERIESKTMCATANHAWRRKIGLSSIFDPKGIDVTQDIPSRADSIRNAGEDFGWLGARGGAWTQQPMGSPGSKISMNGRVRSVRYGQSEDGQRGMGSTHHEMDNNACEDLPKLPWVRAASTQSFDKATADKGLPPAKFKAGPLGFLLPTGHRRPAIPNCPINGHDGMRPVTLDSARPLSLRQLQCSRQLAKSVKLATNASQQRAYAELQMPYGSSRQGPELPPQTQIEQQKLLCPADGLLNLFGLPTCLDQPPKQVEESRDGSNSPVTSHPMRKHLSTMSRGWGSVPNLEPKRAPAQQHKINPSNEVVSVPCEISDQQLLYRASAQAVPREFGAGDTVTLQSSGAPRWLGTRNDQGRPIQQMMTVARSSAPRRSGLSTTGLPHGAAKVSSCAQLDNYADSVLPIRYHQAASIAGKTAFENWV